MKRYGLIGFPLSHSFSLEYFRRKFEDEKVTDCEYNIYPLATLDEFIPLTEKIKFDGLNVTVPYKEKIVDYLDVLSEEAKEIGAVNTIVFKNGLKIGHNSDVWGFEVCIKDVLKVLQTKNKKALILGSGGASLAVKYVLLKYQVAFTTVSRDEHSGISYHDIDKPMMREHKLIINTTPLGMYPNLQTFPDIPYKYLEKSHFLFDLVYNPKKTVFLTNGIKQHCTIQNGLDMLKYQAEKSWQIWNQN
ncbi:MAG: shikimate dehydrogenase [Saprospiraceae bacterium]